MAEAKSDKGGKPAKADKPAAKAGKAEGAAEAKGADQGRQGEAKAAEAKAGKAAKVARARSRAQSEAAEHGQPKAPPKDYVARLKKLYAGGDRAEARQGVRLQERAAGAEDRQDRAQHGRRRSGQRHQEGDRRRRPTSR